jgi:2-oxoglutarate/2-oxoacid ferredoxin oxidoreductase subunit alpha
VRDRGVPVAHAHLRHLEPLPANVGEVLRAFSRVLVPELNGGQLAQLLRARFLVDVRSHTKVTGQPLFAAELELAILETIDAEVPA